MDKLISLVAPTYAGAAIHHAAGNYQSMVCSLAGVNATYKETKNKGATTWNDRVLVGLSRIGNDALRTSHVITARPFNQYLDPEVWHMQCHYNAAGVVTGTGGALHQIDPEGVLNKTNFTVAGFPLESVAWSRDGRVFLAAGDASAGTIQARGNFNDDLPDAGVAVNWGITVGQRVIAVFPIDDPRASDVRYTFLVAQTQGAVEHLKRIFRGIGFTGLWTIGAGFIGPIAADWGNFIQIRNLILAFDRANPNCARSQDWAQSFPTNVSVGGGGPINGSFRYGNRIYAICRDAPRVRFSRNFGISWVTSPVQPPDPGVQLTAAIVTQFFGDIYLLGNDGAVNRFYKYRPAMDI